MKERLRLHFYFSPALGVRWYVEDLDSKLQTLRFASARSAIYAARWIGREY